MDEPIEEIYFRWLYSKVASVDVPTPSLTYWTLFQTMHSTEFVWLLPGDDNRAEDGLDMRKEFLREAQLDQEPAWMDIPCSVLEMLVAFTRLAAFETDICERDWFWVFMQNLKLDHLNDGQTRIAHKANGILEHLVWRTYHSDGNGGLFPLRRPEHDQRTVDIWYQFCEYLADQTV